MFTVNPRINMYTGNVDIYVEENGELKEFIRGNIRGVFEGFESGECRPLKEMLDEILSADEKGDELGAQMARVKLRGMLTKAVVKAAEGKLESKGIKLEEEEKKKLDLALVRVTDDTLFSYVLFERAKREQERRNKQKEEKEKEIKIDVKFD